MHRFPHATIVINNQNVGIFDYCCHRFFPDFKALINKITGVDFTKSDLIKGQL
jgi:hypothetical protein